MRITNMNRCTLAVSVALANGLTASQAHSQALEEVFVTATKQSVGMQDVPIALSVMDGEKIIEQGIGSLTDMAVFMPNVHVAEAAAGDQLFIRGIGSGINYGFEQSVGTFIDGVYFGRGQASRSAFLDVERVEVLKGSQSTLFGKNTIAGAINISTAKPTDDSEVSILLTAEPEFDGTAATFIASGPITDTFSARLAVKYEDTDGWMTNLFLGEDEVAREDKVARITLGWEPTDTVTAYFKYETGKSDSVGSNSTLVQTTPTSEAIYSAIDPNFSDSVGFDYNKSNASFAERSQPSFHDSQWDIATLTAQWDIGEHTLKSISGYVDYQFVNYRDNDSSPLAAIARGRDERHEQFTQEFLLISPQSDTFEYLAGAFYQKEELGHERFTDVSLAALANAGVEFIVNGNDQTALVGSGIADATGLNTFDQDAESWSTFAQGTWHATDAFRVIGGLRYSHDQKEIEKTAISVALLTEGPESELLSAVYDKTLNLATKHSFGNGLAEVCPATNRDQPGLSTTITCETIPFDTKRAESHVTGDLTLQWDASDDTMLYAKYGNGYKAGGFDEDNGRGNTDTGYYEDETSDTFEIGAKMDLWDGRGRFNVAVFHSEYQDVQVSTFDGNAGFVVGNAAETEVEGIEVDGMFAVTETFVIFGAASWLDAKYKDFPNAGCTNDQIQSFVASGGAAADCIQDLAGQRLQFAPDWSASFGANYSVAVSDNLEVVLGTDIMYSDAYDTAADGDAVLVQDSFTKINARIELAEVEGSWSIAVLGKNLTDETTSTWGNDVPLGAFGFAGTYFKHVDAPRSFEIQARYQF
ncbi:MAG: iron complex outermembrane receptor protein [Halioglobus sp.]|jgi:iron complex outermembrane receptor protein